MSTSTHTANLKVLAFLFFFFCKFGELFFGVQGVLNDWWQWWVNWHRRSTWPACSRRVIKMWAATGSDHYFSSSSSAPQAVKWRELWLYNRSLLALKFSVLNLSSQLIYERGPGIKTLLPHASSRGCRTGKLHVKQPWGLLLRRKVRGFFRMGLFHHMRQERKRIVGRKGQVGGAAMPPPTLAFRNTNLNSLGPTQLHPSRWVWRGRASSRLPSLWTPT